MFCSGRYLRKRDKYQLPFQIVWRASTPLCQVYKHSLSVYMLQWNSVFHTVPCQVKSSRLSNFKFPKQMSIYFSIFQQPGGNGFHSSRVWINKVSVYICSEEMEDFVYGTVLLSQYRSVSSYSMYPEGV